MKILITGITSALGSAIAKQMEGHEVIGLARTAHPVYPTICHDLRTGIPRLPDVDVCLHLAFATDPVFCRDHRREAHQVNVLGTKSLLKSAARFVFVSSGSVYGYQDGLSLETRVPLPANEYARMKLEAEEMVKGHPRWAVLRLFYPYGPQTKPESLVNRLIRRIDAGAEIARHVDGRPRINPIYISDLVGATRLFCLRDVNGLHNVAGKEVVSIEELATRIGRYLGRPPVFCSTGTEIKDIAGSTARQSLVFQPTVSLADGLCRTIRSLLETRWRTVPRRPARGARSRTIHSLETTRT